MADEPGITGAAAVLRTARRVLAFTGAGISVASGIPPFRGEDGLWTRFDPSSLALDTFLDDPAAAWRFLNEIFYLPLAGAAPNPAHRALASLERAGRLAAVATQNVDGLHRAAGSRRVHELHGTLRRLRCLACEAVSALADSGLGELPPTCRLCGGILRPEIVFFDEGLAEPARSDAFAAAAGCDAILVIGTSGEVLPAGLLPWTAAEHGATVIEINTVPSAYTEPLTDLFLQGSATALLPRLAAALDLAPPPAE
ncbi:MAG TPA: NAD-dependent protein deacylase [Thermoanaerobaculia bacterium]|nr:NAD-dependent protein deacylase [Thermoanaerobaculia bacterium]